MRRREFIALMGASVVVPFAATAQEPGRTYRLGYISPLPCEPLKDHLNKELSRYGFTEGKNLTFYCRDFSRQIDLSSEYALEMVKAQVDVLVAGGDVAIRAAQHATATIPIVGITQDMVGSGFVKSMARPNGITTGVSILAAELDGKRQEILIEAVPGLHRMAALADSTTKAEHLDALQEAARARNIELSIHRIASGEEIAGAIDTAHGSGAAALNVLSSPLLFTYRQLIMDQAAALRLPAIYEWAEMAWEGGFAAYGPRVLSILPDHYALMIVKLLRGTKVADIPVEQPTKFELVVNLKTANVLGLTVPPTLLARADEVIE